MAVVDDSHLDAPRLWRLNPNWNWIIVGAVILVAVILYKFVHMVQAAPAA